MDIVYNGPQPSRTIPTKRGGSIKVERGKTVTVPAEIGKSLVRQRHFSEARSPRRSAPVKPATTTKEKE